MSRFIKVGKWLDCGCCGEDFQIWEGYVDQDQDDGYGICHECQEDINVRRQARYEEVSTAYLEIMDADSRNAFLQMPIEDQQKAVEKYILS